MRIDQINFRQRINAEMAKHVQALRAMMRAVIENVKQNSDTAEADRSLAEFAVIKFVGYYFFQARRR